ncbi:uncharacterized protein N7459_000037 [Penicillium hispanicum]|uniref:uncharacterized protein n=1 Tax=Penicillium hispanicum TaxID=1080232 RepID=UPI002541C505|nr:uncharacterized protein N7459_000037 [Penicillium hispanicum]KAJ5593829.1 hypothetical protein N7459_000037 [Penicillium hispanicum]
MRVFNSLHIRRRWRWVGDELARQSSPGTARTWVTRDAFGLRLNAGAACLATRGGLLGSLTASSMSQKQVAYSLPAGRAEVRLLVGVRHGGGSRKELANPEKFDRSSLRQLSNHGKLRGSRQLEASFSSSPLLLRGNRDLVESHKNHSEEIDALR